MLNSNDARFLRRACLDKFQTPSSALAERRTHTYTPHDTTRAGVIEARTHVIHAFKFHL